MLKQVFAALRAGCKVCTYCLFEGVKTSYFAKQVFIPPNGSKIVYILTSRGLQEILEVHDAVIASCKVPDGTVILFDLCQSGRVIDVVRFFPEETAA